MAPKSKVVLLAELKEKELDLNIQLGKDLDLILEQAKKVPEKFSDEFCYFFELGPDRANLSVEFIAEWETNPDLKEAIKTVLYYYADALEKFTQCLRALGE